MSLFIYLHLALPFLGFAHLYNSNIAVFGAITGVGLAAAPLATVREVLRTKDASSIPSTLVLMQFIQFFSWTVYGWVVVDWSTFANNLVGVILGSFQLFLIGYFGSSYTFQISTNFRHLSFTYTSYPPLHTCFLRK